MLLGILPRAQVTIGDWKEAGSWIGKMKLDPFGDVILAEWSISALLRVEGEAAFLWVDTDEYYDPQSGLKVHSNSTIFVRGDVLLGNGSWREVVTCEYVNVPPTYKGPRASNSADAIDSKLLEIQKLLKKGLITKDEAAKKRREIVTGL